MLMFQALLFMFHILFLPTVALVQCWDISVDSFRKNLNFSSLITLATIVFYMLKITIKELRYFEILGHGVSRSEDKMQANQEEKDNYVDLITTLIPASPYPWGHLRSQKPGWLLLVSSLLCCRRIAPGLPLCKFCQSLSDRRQRCKRCSHLTHSANIYVT